MSKKKTSVSSISPDQLLYTVLRKMIKKNN